ncbi:hypothetical protein [Dyella thiooxydans]|nr:hypothetical protein [Dyella thiooxydans]
MMRPGPMFSLVFGGLLSAGVAAASGVSPPHDAGKASLAKAHQAEASHAAEVARLKHRVAEQEARSRQASQRLREQDQALERLHRELKAAGVSDDAVATGP